MILEGAAERLDEHVPLGVLDAYEAKYGWRMAPDDPEMPYFALRPRAVLAWSSSDVRGTAARWKLD